MDKRNRENINYTLGRQQATITQLTRRSGWKGLAGAIVDQAIKDYKGKSTSYRELCRIKLFLLSDWCIDFLNIDGEYIIRKLDEYRREKGYVVISINDRGGFTRSRGDTGGTAVDPRRDKKG